MQDVIVVVGESSVKRAGKGRGPDAGGSGILAGAAVGCVATKAVAECVV